MIFPATPIIVSALTMQTMKANCGRSASGDGKDLTHGLRSHDAVK
ncbi:MAG: hypothetical protein AAFO84_09065 [Cyanobacteria bacterium J06598_1]